MTKQAIITVPNRNIIAGEYNGAYGYNTTHVDTLRKYLTFRNAEIVQQENGNQVAVTINYTGTFGKRNLEEVERFYQKGFITDLVY